MGWTDCSAWDFNSGWRNDQTKDEKEDCLEMYYKEINPARTLTDQTGVLGQGIQWMSQKLSLLHGWNDALCSQNQRYVCKKKICPGDF